MEELIVRHSAIMNRYDPENRIALIVDEWGTWFSTEPGDTALKRISDKLGGRSAVRNFHPLPKGLL